jgi:membrane protease YdiL (CAAX protease family)
VTRTSPQFPARPMPSKAASPRNLLTSLVLVFPLFLIYQLGVLFTLPMLNGADFVTILLLQTLGLSVKGYLGFLGGVLLLFLGTLLVLRRHQRFDRAMVLPVILESLIWALTMGSLIVFVMTRILGINPRLAAGIEGQGLMTRFVMSLGAGVYEETVFRLGLMSVLALALEKLVKVVRWLALLIALLLSATVFSAMHHLPPYGDPLTLSPFVFRILAGVFFGLLFWRRGFAVAVYTHAFYDVFVLVVR